MTGNSDGSRFGALGFLGGTTGKKHKLGILRKGKKVTLRTMDVQYLRPGDIIWSRSGGGGGIGYPFERDVEKVREDVRNEYISGKRARSVYGVILDPETFEVDYAATAKLRKRMSRKNKEQG